MKKISKAMAVLLSILMLFSSFPAFALTEGSSYDFEEKYLNAYYDTGRWETADGHVHDNYGQVALRWLKNTGEPLYCIQIYNGVDSSAAKATDITKTNLWSNELTRGQQNDIKLVSIYGYPNYNYGYSWENAQLATQVLLWEIETHARTDFSTGCSSWAKTIFNNYPDALNCYNKILEACSKHGTRPSFGTTTIELKGSGESNAVTLTDSNGVLSNFSVTSSNENIRVSKSGNTLKVWSRNSGNISAALTFTKYKTDINSAFALTGANQTLFYGTLADPVTTRLNVKISTSIIKIVKSSEDGIIEGFHFTINGPGFAAEVVTDKNGVATCEVPYTDTYYIVREKLQVGQERYNQPDRQNVTVKAGETSTVSFSNSLTKANIKLEKRGEVFSSVLYDEENQLYQPVYEETGIANAVYDIYAAEDIIGAGGNVVVAKDTIVDAMTTDEDGTAISSDLPLKTDGTAKYYIKESSAPYGFVLDDTVYEVELKKDGDTPVISTVSVSDTRQKVQVSLTKSLEIDEFFNIGNNAEIQNVVFGLYAAEDITAADGTVIPQDGLLELMKVNSDSTVQTESDLPFGSYYLKEIETEEHYILSEEIYPFTFEYENSSTDIVAINLTESGAVENKIKRGRIEGLKTDNNGNALEGAVIGLFYADETELTKDTAILTIESDKDGKFSFDNLPVSKYKVKELTSPDGYTLDDRVYEVEITEDGQTVEISIINTEIPIPVEKEEYISPKTGKANTTVFVFTLSVSATAILYFLTKKFKGRKTKPLR